MTKFRINSERKKSDSIENSNDDNESLIHIHQMKVEGITSFFLIRYNPIFSKTKKCKFETKSSANHASDCK